METVRLKQFCVVAESGSLTRAAEILGVTHSALSKSIKILQIQLGQQIVQASGRGLVLTNAGFRIYERAKEVLKAEEKLFESSEMENTSSLGIGTTEIFLSAIANGMKVEAFKAKNISILDLEPGEIEHQISTGKLDFGVTYVPMSMKDLVVIPINKLYLGCYHHRDHFTNCDLKDLPFIVPAKGLTENPLNIRGRDGWPEDSFPRKKKFQVNLLSTGLALAINGTGAIFIPRFIAKAINDSFSDEVLIERKLPQEFSNPHQKAYAMRHRNRLEDTCFRRLCSILRSTLRDQEGGQFEIPT